MKTELTEEQSNIITSYSEEPERQYIYSLSDMWLLVPKSIMIDNSLYELFLTFISEEDVYMIGLTNGFGYVEGNKIVGDIVIEFKEGELIDCLYDLIIWIFEKTR